MLFMRISFFCCSYKTSYVIIRSSLVRNLCELYIGIGKIAKFEFERIMVVISFAQPEINQSYHEEQTR